MPLRRALFLLNKLRVPVYKAEVPRTYKCHISHILKRLTYRAMASKMKDGFDPSGIEAKHFKNLKKLWELQYPDLAKETYLPNYDSGRLWAALFIVSCMKKIVNSKKLNDKDICLNFKAKEKKDREAKEAQARKDKIAQQIKKKRLEQREAKQSKKDKSSDKKDKKGKDKKKDDKSMKRLNLQRLRKESKLNNLDEIKEKKRLEKEAELKKRAEADMEFAEHLNQIVMKGELMKTYKISELPKSV